MASAQLPIKNSRNILELSTLEKRQFLNSFNRVFSDIDGVVWVLQHDIQGAADGINELRKAGKPVTFITNNSVRKTDDYEKKFRKINLDVNVSDIIHPVKSIVDYLNYIKFKGLIYVIATENFKKYLREAGYQIIDGPNEIIEESYTALGGHVFDGQQVNAIIIDVDYNLSSAKLIRAHVYLRNPDCLLIAGATDMLLPVRKDISIIGPGPFANVLAESSGRKMRVLGKPGGELAEMIIKRFNINDTKRNLMIGDMLEQDIGFGKRCGFQTMVVLSGGCKREDLIAETNPERIPDYYAESISDFVKFFKDLQKSNV